MPFNNHVANEDQQRADNDQSKPRSTAANEGANAATARRLRRRLTLTVMLLFCPLFLHNCSLNELKLSVGPAAPIFVVELDDDDFWPKHVGEFSALGLVANIGFAFGLVWLLPLKRVQAFLQTRTFRISLWTFAIVANSILIGCLHPLVVQIWHWGMLMPIAWIGDVVQPGVATLFAIHGEANVVQERQIRITSFAISSRLYFVIVLAVGPLAVAGVRWFRRSVLQVSPDRWWQFTLRGWIVLTLVISVVLGVVIRFLVI